MTSWWKWLNQHRMKGETDAELSRRIGASRTDILYWKRGAKPNLQTVKDIYWALKLPPEVFWATVKEIYEPMLEGVTPAAIKQLPKDHICRLVMKYIKQDDLDSFLRAIGVPRWQWDEWQKDDELDLPFQKHSRIANLARNWTEK